MTFVLAIIISLAIIGVQAYFFRCTWENRDIFQSFFRQGHTEGYATEKEDINGGQYLQIRQLSTKDSGLAKLIDEINEYVVKTKGTTNFSIIQNKIERKLKVLYNQAVARVSFPIYIGLMGTFIGVFVGILTFLHAGFNGVGEVTDVAIENLLIGVLISMSTSFVGLFLATTNNALTDVARKQVDEDKEEFYNFIQTELLPSLDVSIEGAIGNLRSTISHFAPAFEGVLVKFKDTFDRCTTAFGEHFEHSVTTVANAVSVMGENMDKINENIALQRDVIAAVKSGELVEGMERYVEASRRFSNLSKSLSAFEEAQKAMQEAVKEAVTLQGQYNSSLEIPRDIAVNLKNILDRLVKFEKSINELGDRLNEREILGNDIVNAIGNQVNSIVQKNSIAQRYSETANENLEKFFQGQTQTIGELNKACQNTLATNIAEFDAMMQHQTEELKKRHSDFKQAIETLLSTEEVRSDFKNLRRLNDILNQLERNGSEIENLRRGLDNMARGKASTGEIPPPPPKRGFFKRLFRGKKRR